MFELSLSCTNRCGSLLLNNKHRDGVWDPVQDTERAFHMSEMGYFYYPIYKKIIERHHFNMHYSESYV